MQLQGRWPVAGLPSADPCTALRHDFLGVRSLVQVIFLDSDNVAVSDPASLLQSEEFRQTGALLWPDYWDSTAAPDLATILDVSSLPSGSFESGQMVFDKKRCVLVVGLLWCFGPCHNMLSAGRAPTSCCRMPGWTHV